MLVLVTNQKTCFSVDFHCCVPRKAYIRFYRRQPGSQYQINVVATKTSNQAECSGEWRQIKQTINQTNKTIGKLQSMIHPVWGISRILTAGCDLRLWDKNSDDKVDNVRLNKQTTERKTAAKNFQGRHFKYLTSMLETMTLVMWWWHQMKKLW